ncbi:MAG: glycosyltransferase [Actinobacteria bacterium]|nr:glycosyltransferase [Actinomycetota bacterium]
MTDAPVVLLVTTNGAGMGHLARQTAVAQSAQGFRPFLVSMSVGIATVLPATGMPGEYIPGYHRGWVPRGRWDAYLTARLSALVDATNAAGVVFDGVAPYRGITALARARRDLPMVWFRRGLWRDGVNTRALRSARYFDRIIEPGDAASAADRGATASRQDATRVGPVTLLETTLALERGDAAAQLGLDPDRRTLLITLGAGNLNDTSAPTTAVLRAALDAPGDWQIALTSAPIADSTGDELADRVTVLRGVFPLVRYRAAFDAVVAASGYNAVHEFVLGGIPTLLIPNPAAATDDQVTRARQLADVGRALSAPEDEPVAIGTATGDLLSTSTLERLRAANPQRAIDGASAAARIISEAIGSHPPRRPTVDPLVLRADALTGVRGVLGDERYRTLTHRLGRPQMDLTPRSVRIVTSAQTSVGEGERALLMTPDLSAVTPAADPIVEHLGLESAEYQRERRAIITRFYDVRGNQ